MGNLMSDFSARLRSDSEKGNLLFLQAAEYIERLEESLERVKRDCSFWKAVAQESANENRRSNADNG